MRKIRLMTALFLIAVGMAIFLYDAYVIFRYGYDFNDVVGITEDGGPIDWPTGERPPYTFIPAFIYSFGFWLAAATVFSLWPGIAPPYRGRVYRGTE